MKTQTRCCPLCNRRQSVWFFADKKNFKQTYYRCPLCDLVFVIPECRLDATAEKARYDQHQNDDSSAYRRFLSRLATPTLSHLPPRCKGLDFGSGKSQAMAELFRQNGHQCDCYDVYYYPDPTLLKTQYDFIVASEVIEHLYQPKVVFEQWLSLLKVGGILAIMTGFRPGDKDFSDWWYKNDPTHVGLYSVETFTYLQKTYGLTVLQLSNNVGIFTLLNKSL